MSLTAIKHGLAGAERKRCQVPRRAERRGRTARKVQRERLTLIEVN